MRFSEFQTVLYEAAQLVNQRPIGNHPTHPNEESYLSPNDLLLGRSSPDVPQVLFEVETNSCNRYNFTQIVISTVWRRWIREVFQNLVVQRKWHTEIRELVVGDVVLVQDANALRGQWKKALLVGVQPSGDGKI